MSHFTLLDLDSFTASARPVNVAFELRLLQAIDRVQFFCCCQNQRVLVSFVDFAKALP